VAFPADIFQNSEIQTGDFIGAFTMDGICSGRLEVLNKQQNISLTAFANDPLTPGKDGFDVAEPFAFKVYRPKTDMVFELEIDFDLAMPNTGYFAAHGISAVSSLKLQPTGAIENTNISMEIYPNPSNGIFNVSINKSLVNPEIQITDSRGRLLKDIQYNLNAGNKSVSVDLSDLPIGVYFLRLMDEGYVGLEKIILH
jgi:hypothetical protein